MTQDIIKKLHELEYKRDRLKEHIDWFMNGKYGENGSTPIYSKIMVRQGFSADDLRDDTMELSRQFLPFDFIGQYLREAKNRLKEYEDAIEKL